MQYQINPHFLYNSILIVYNLIKMYEYEDALKLSQHLAHYYQYITKTLTDTVPLSKEIAHAKDYVEIQTARFLNRFHVEFDDIPEGCKDLQVPKLILQPLIENAFKYGLKNKVKDARLKVGMKRNGNCLYVSVEDNGQETGEYIPGRLARMMEQFDTNSERTGLFNVHRRLQIKYGPDSGLSFARNEDGGLRVELRIVCGEESFCVQSADSG